jgi:prolyl-tRNA editing enzyme YbaK/EbsC (Cys-tRNA(Pro) deacylase)
MKFGALDFVEATTRPKLVAPVTLAAIQAQQLPDVWVAEIDTALADTAAFCEAYNVGMDVSANCVIVEAKRADKTWHAACMILATDRVDVNGIVRRHLDARKISFARMDNATEMTSMEYGGINPIGLPEGWEILVDTAITKKPWVIIGSGIRGSKILIPGALLAKLPHVTVLDIAKKA